MRNSGTYFMIRINIDLTKIKESGKYRTGKNKRNYIDLVVSERKSPDSDGNTHFVAISQSKEEREARTETIYVGSGKEFGVSKPQQQPAQQYNNTDDLAF